MSYVPRRDFDKGGRGGGGGGPRDGGRDDEGYDGFMKAKGRRESIQLPSHYCADKSRFYRTCHGLRCYYHSLDAPPPAKVQGQLPRPS